MPGIVGVLSKKGQKISKSNFETFLNSLKYFDFYKQENFETNTFLASWSGLGDSAGVYQDKRGASVITGYLIINDRPIEGREAAQYALEIFFKESDYISHFEGCFSLVLYCCDKILLINDRQAVSPLYYWETNDYFYFSSELKSFRALKEFKPSLNIESALEFLCLGYPLGDKTLYKDIFRQPAATILEVTTKKLEFNKYWDFNFKNKFKEGEEVLIGRLAELLTKAVDKTIDSEDGVRTVYLSGGLDSRLIVGLLEKRGIRLSTNNFGSQGSLDVTVAQQIARLVKTKHLFTDINPSFISKYAYQMIFLTESRFSEFMPAIIKDLSSRETKFAYCGYYLDALVGSYASFFNFFKKSPSKVTSEGELKDSLYMTHCRGLSPELAAKLIKTSFSKEQLKKSLFNQINFKSCGFYVDMAEYFLYTQKERNYVLHSMLLLGKFFKLRFPLIDYRLLEFCPRLKVEYKKNQKLFTKVFVKLLPKLSSVIWTRTNAPVDAGFFRKAMGLLNKYWHFLLINLVPKITLGKLNFNSKFQYSKRNNWLRHELKDFAETILFSKKTLNRSIYNESILRRIWQDYLLGKGSGIGLLAVIILEIWQRIFIDGEKVNLDLLFEKKQK